jgi:hypothetical protein
MQTGKKPRHNSTFAIGGVSCSTDSFVVAENFVLRINISGKNPAHRKSAKRWWKCQKNPGRKEKIIKKFAECYLIK